MNMKTFNQFINEELDKSTYLSAADKLKDKGHSTRSEKLRSHAKDMETKSLNEVEPVTLEMYGETYLLWPQNIVIVENEGGKRDFMMIEIPFDQITGNRLEAEEECSKCLSFYKENGKYRSVDIDGIVIPERKLAVKVLRTVKEYCKRAGSDELNTELAKVTVNDMYEN